MAPSGPEARSHHPEQQPGNRTRLDETWVGGGSNRHCPYRAGVPGVLPRGTGCATFIGVGAQKMGDDLLVIVVEQGGLRPEKGPGKAGAGGKANVVLGAGGVSLQE